MSELDPVLTIADWPDWKFSGTALAVLGHPIHHSISPAMHNAALARMAERDAKFADWKYFRFDVPPDDLPAALDQLHARGFFGLNLTVPHKIIAFDRVAEIDPAARPVGAINTLRRTETGWHGFNTDGYGLATAVRETLGLHLAGTPIILLGAGGAARSAAVECLQRRCASLWIGNRTQSTLDALLAHLAPLAGPLKIQGFNPAQPPRQLPARALVINATSAGLKPDDPAPIDLSSLARPAGVFDMIYNPPRTPLLAQAESLGLQTANGLSMLVHQGARALEIWSKATVPVEAMRTAAKAAMAAR